MSCGAKINDEALISEVEKRPLIYNPALSTHKNKLLRRNTWMQIGNRLGLKANVCKERWRHLRDRYRKEKNALKRSSGNSSQTTVRRKWRLFDVLSFLDSFCCIDEDTWTLQIEKGHSRKPIVHNISVVKHESDMEIFPLSLEIASSSESCQGNDSIELIESCSESKHSTNFHKRQGDSDLDESNSLTDEKEDEFDKFGAFVSSQIRNFNPAHKREAYERITHVLFDILRHYE